MNEAEQLLYKYYEEDNYEIVDFDTNHHEKDKLCYIFFSSNGLYRDRNDVDIIKKMHDSNRYEWKFISSNKSILKKATRIIYFRDIYKAFYIHGINKRICSIDKMRELLTKETMGMKVVLAGSSAGAYMALLMGNMLPNTYKVLSLGGVVDLDDWKDFSEYLSKNIYLSDYYNIKDHLYGHYWIVNFFGEKNLSDTHNANLINNYANNLKLINIGFDADSHAPRPTGDDLIQLLVCDDKHLEHLQKKMNGKSCVKKNGFSRYNIGVFKTYFNETKSALIKLFKKK